jgi:hypothetical protein
MANGSRKPRGPRDIGMATRLNEQLSNYLQAEHIKQNKRLLDEIAFYPAHDKRAETPEYHKVHDYMVKKRDLPCLVCGVRNSTLKDPAKNRYYAKQMETHHHVIEWALANAIDVDRFNEVLRPNLAHQHPVPEVQSTKKLTVVDSEYWAQMYAGTMSKANIAAWVDHSPDNLWVLCDVHHRARYFGIHEITYPIWCPADLLRPDFERFVQKQLDAAASDAKSNTKTG